MSKETRNGDFEVAAAFLEALDETKYEPASTYVRKAAVAALAAGANIAPQTEDEVEWFGIEESSEEGEDEAP